MKLYRLARVQCGIYHWYKLYMRSINLPSASEYDLFTREMAAEALPFTGERMTSAIGGQVMVEHYHRYMLARDYCHGRDVLDIASGEGYGTAMLAQVARTATGVEIDPVAVAAAAREFARPGLRPGLRYLVGDAAAIPLPDACLDVVVSFETLEHFAGQEGFLDECRRVLRPDGLIIISTPDRDIYSAPGLPLNPFHVRELDRAEFTAMLGARFAHVGMAAQRPLIGSAIMGEGPGLTTRIFDTRPGNQLAAAGHLLAAPYLIAFASAVPLPAPVASLFIARDDLDTDPVMRRAAEERALAAEARAAAAGQAAAVAVAVARQAAAKATQAREAAEHRLDHALERLAAAEARAHQGDVFAASDAGRAAIRLMALAQRWPWLARPARRAILLTWWTATGQLPWRLRSWRAARRGGGLPAATDAATLAMAPGVAPAEAQAAVLPLAEIRRELGMAEPGMAPHPGWREPAFPPAGVQAGAQAGASPLVSLIIPTYGQVDYTLRCLDSIARAMPRAAIEIIVAEDASGDPAIAELRRLPGIRLIEHPANLGFLRSGNVAAAAARGSYLLFLNNDTEVLPGAIDALVDTAESLPDAGLVGARLVYPDGTLQEAGGIVWRDGSAWNYGRGQDPRRPEFNYLRPADYCSGAAILVRREAFDLLGGFDDAYAPAYYEDTDLAFRLRAVGLATYYQPLAVVVHHEGISHGTDTGSGIKAYQVANQARLAERWATVLASEHFAPGTEQMRARDRARSRPIVLVIDHKVLEPDRDAGSRSTMEHIRALLRAGWVVKFRPDNGLATPVYTQALEAMGIEVLHAPFVADFAVWMEANGHAIDHVLLNRPQVAHDLLPIIRSLSTARVVFYGHDLHFARMQRAAALGGDPQGDAGALAASERMLATERAVWRDCDTVLYPSEEEAAEVRRLEPLVHVQAVTPYSFAEFPRRAAVAPASGGLLFVAGFAHPPNVDAARWLVQDVLPLIRQQLPGVHLTLAGSNPTDEVLALATEGVIVTGSLSAEALAGHYAAARVAVVPLRFGAGVKLKVVEALQQGLPLVTTPIGAQGLPGLSAILPVAADPAALAAEIVRLFRDDAAWLRQSAAQSAYAERHFSEAVLQASILSAFVPAASETRRAA